jgi:hypothetical protein
VPSERCLQASNTAASAALSGAHALQNLNQDGQDCSGGEYSTQQGHTHLPCLRSVITGSVSSTL